MTNLKKIGLSALAGSLVATSAFAGALDVTGTAKVTYVSQDETEVTGNPYSTTNTLTFSGSGDLDNGMSIAYSQSIDGGAFSSHTLSLDMGDAGTLSIANESGLTGISAYDDKMPTAGEEVWDDLDGQANGMATIDDGNTLGYTNSFGMFGVSASYNKDAAVAATTATSSKSLVLSADPMDGMSVFYGKADKSGTTVNNGDDIWTAGVTYATGAVTVGAQTTSVDKDAANSDQDRNHVAISFAVNEDLSISYGMSTVEFESASKSDQEDSGFAASYTMGSMTIAAFANSSDNVGGTSGTDDTVKEISVAFAF